MGIDAGVIRLTKLNPFPADALEAAISGYQKILVVEEAAAGSGIYDTLAASIHKIIPDCQVFRRDLGAGFVPHGNVNTLYQHYGLDGASIADFAKEALQHEN